MIMNCSKFHFRNFTKKVRWPLIAKRNSDGSKVNRHEYASRDYLLHKLYWIKRTRVFVLLFSKITGNDEITGGTMKRLQCGRGFCHVTTMASLIQIILKFKLGLNTVSSGPFRCLNQNRKFLVWNLFSESSVKSSWPGMTSSKNNSLFKRSRWPNLISRQWIAYQTYFIYRICYIANWW